MENYRHHVGSDLAESACFLDTFVVLGSLGGQLDVEPKPGLHSGQLAPLSCGSLVWLFRSLAGTASAHGKSTAHYQSGVGCVMWFIALQLARDGIAHDKPCSVRRYLMEK